MVYADVEAAEKRVLLTIGLQRGKKEQRFLWVKERKSPSNNSMILQTHVRHIEEPTCILNLSRVQEKDCKNFLVILQNISIVTHALSLYFRVSTNARYKLVNRLRVRLVGS